MIDDARAKELAKLARKGKRGRKKKKEATKEEPKPPGKEKKPTKTPVVRDCVKSRSVFLQPSFGVSVMQNHGGQE